MFDLNNPSSFKHLDPKNVFGSTEMLADQCEQIWNDAKNIKFSIDPNKIQNIIISGMGGSAYGGHVVSSLFKNVLKIPLYVNNNYNLPAFAKENSLVLLTSYSGSTEETLSSFEDAKNRNCMVSGLTSGGKLGELLKNYTSLIFNPKFNPSGQPRLGTGYIVLGTIALLNRLGLVNTSDKEIQSAIENLKTNKENIKNKAIEIAKSLQNYIPVIFAAEFLQGNAHIIRNQFNETAKTFSSYSSLPELNHHLMEGLKNPKNKNLSVLFINSSLYSEKIKKRLDLTKDVVSKNGVPYFEYEAVGNSELSQVLNLLSFGGYVTFYLAILYAQDPSLIPWVDYFKEKLA